MSTRVVMTPEGPLELVQSYIEIAPRFDVFTDLVDATLRDVVRVGGDRMRRVTFLVIYDVEPYHNPDCPGEHGGANVVLMSFPPGTPVERAKHVVVESSRAAGAMPDRLAEITLRDAVVSRQGKIASDEIVEVLTAYIVEGGREPYVRCRVAHGDGFTDPITLPATALRPITVDIAAEA